MLNNYSHKPRGGMLAYRGLFFPEHAFASGMGGRDMKVYAFYGGKILADFQIKHLVDKMIATRMYIPPEVIS